MTGFITLILFPAWWNSLSLLMSLVRGPGSLCELLTPPTGFLAKSHCHTIFHFLIHDSATMGTRQSSSLECLV